MKHWMPFDHSKQVEKRKLCHLKVRFEPIIRKIFEIEFQGIYEAWERQPCVEILFKRTKKVNCQQNIVNFIVQNAIIFILFAPPEWFFKNLFVQHPKEQNTIGIVEDLLFSRLSPHPEGFRVMKLKKVHDILEK